MDDASLDDFLDTGDGETGGGGGEPTDRGGETTDGDDAETDENGEWAGRDAAEPRATAVDPATATLQWSPEGGECEACGTVVDQRWHSGTGLVCVECKEW